MTANEFWNYESKDKKIFNQSCNPGSWSVAGLSSTFMGMIITFTVAEVNLNLFGYIAAVLWLAGYTKKTKAYAAKKELSAMSNAINGLVNGADVNANEVINAVTKILKVNNNIGGLNAN